MSTFDFDFIRSERKLSKQVLDAAYEEALRALPLAALRTESGVTQSAMARRLGKSQAAVSKFEGRGDFLLSTLHRYVEAIGGGVEISIRTSDKNYKLEKNSDSSGAGTAFSLRPEVQSELQIWESIAQVNLPHAISTKTPGAGAFWNRREKGVEEIDVFVELASCANDYEWPEAA